MPDEDSGLFYRAEKLLREFGKVRHRVGATFAVLIALAISGGVVWWFWEEIAEKPFVKDIITWIERKSIVPATVGHLTIAVAHLEDDTGRAHEKLLRDALDNDFKGAETKPIDRTITLLDADTGQAAVLKATEEARRLLQRAGADVLLWGRVVTLDGKSVMRLYWTLADDLPGIKPTATYQATETIALPPLFWDDLKQVLGVLVQSRIASITQQLTGQYFADRLTPLIGQVRKLLQARQGVWIAETEAGVRFAFAVALEDYGEQAGKSAALRESIDAYRQVLTSEPREQVPLDWAVTQMNLGNALLPLAWAVTQMNLGSVFSRLGERESGTARLEEAAVGDKAALEIFVAAKADYYIDVCRNNLEKAKALLADRKR